MSPFLFSIYFNDMKAEFQRMGGDIDGVSIGDLRLMLLLYADDAVMHSDTPHGLQNILTRLHIYAQKWN